MILCVAAIPRGSPRSKQRQGVVEPISSRFWKLAKRRRPDPCYFEGAYNSVCEADTVMPLGDNTANSGECYDFFASHSAVEEL